MIMFDSLITTRKFMNNASGFFAYKTGEGVYYSARKIFDDVWKVARHDLNEYQGTARGGTYSDNVSMGVVQGRVAVIQALASYEEGLKKNKYDRVEELPNNSHYSYVAKCAGIYIDKDGHCFDVNQDAVVTHVVNFKTRALGELYNLAAAQQPKPVIDEVTSWDVYFATVVDNHAPLSMKSIPDWVLDWCTRMRGNIQKMHAAVADPSMAFSDRRLAINSVSCYGIRVDADLNLQRVCNIWRLTALLQAGQTVCRQMFDGAAMSADAYGLLSHISDSAHLMVSNYLEVAEPSAKASILNLMAMPDGKPRKDQPLERLLKRLDKKTANPENGYSP